MRKIIFLFFIILSLPNTLWAADPIIGTWKLNIAKSVLPADQKNIKEDINIYRDIEGDLMELAISTVFEDGSTDSGKWTWPREGGVAKCLSKTLPAGLLYVEGYVEPGHWFAVITQNGNQVGLYHKIISKDGKTMTQTFKGVDEQGKSLNIMKIMEKQ
ncbi:MAG: hypothetical protein GX654_03425 [Desulfatiglans sp.]|jgi:hypothetical protein|nr:hypothetical protein [Desulfatiglans sp.]